MRVNCFAQEHNTLIQSGLKPGLRTQSLAHYPVGPLCLVHPDTYILKISSQQKQILIRQTVLSIKQKHYYLSFYQRSQRN